MAKTMLSHCDQLKVNQAVVKSVMVDVMHLFGSQQRATKGLFHDVAMLQHATTVDLKLSIPSLKRCIVHPRCAATLVGAVMSAKATSLKLPKGLALTTFIR